ncbi:MAG: hypothetical protein H6R14_2324 [Proteobacteria bacterium]|nr:hypothetical protein [Pseudomonadota bacterium]
MSIDDLMNRFRLASRELFNNYFRIDIPSSVDPWLVEERFSNVQDELFQMMVTEPASISRIGYGDLQTDIIVEMRSDSVPWLLNRDKNSGYWDAEPNQVTRDAQLKFKAFFDWDQLSYRDNTYVRVLVVDWPAMPSVVGRDALIEAQYVRYVQA